MEKIEVPIFDTYQEAEKAFKRAIEINTIDEPAYTGLGVCYRKQGKLKEIQELSKKIIKEKVRNDRLFGFVATSYREQENYKEAEEYLRKANEFRLKYHNPVTRHNYQKLKEIVDQRGVRLVCVQYPMRNLEPLKKLFQSTEGIIFVDNEEVFKQALRSTKYEEYFTDQFGGDFGHCTPKGNRLLAENIADVILRECF